MTKLYEIKATIIIKVEADDKHEAQQLAEEIAAEIEAELPVGATLAQQDGRAAGWAALSGAIQI